jgi:hypothetical protein
MYIIPFVDDYLISYILLLKGGKYAIFLETLRGKLLMTNLAHYRYLILAVISFLLSANSPVLAGTNIAWPGNLARAQSVYLDNTPLIVFNYVIAGVLFVTTIGTLIYMLLCMKKSDKKGS